MFFYVFYFAQLQKVDQHIGNSRNIHRKRYNNWHMINFIHCGSEKRVYRFPSGNKLADARKEVANYIGA